jgi:hypothetical protein
MTPEFLTRLCRLLAYAARLFWPVLTGAVALGLGIEAAQQAASGRIDHTVAIAALTTTVLGMIGSAIWAVGTLHALRHPGTTENPPL